MALFDFITGMKEKIGNSDLFNKIAGVNYRNENLPAEDAFIQPLQMNAVGGLDVNKSLQLKQNTTPLTLSDRLFGREMTMDKQTVNPEAGEATMETASNFRPGFLNDLNSGMNENYKADFQINNIAPNQNKGVGYRIGEGLGTIAKSLGGVMGDAYIAGNQGFDAGMKRQNMRTGDQIYREALKQDGIDTNNIDGFVTDGQFKNYSQNNYRNRAIASRNMLGFMKDNTSRAKLISTMYSNNIIDEAEALNLLNEYNIDVSELGIPNQTRKVNLDEAIFPYKVDNMVTRTNATATNAQNNTDRTQAYIQNLLQGGRGGKGQSNTSTDKVKVKVKAPNGAVGSIPAYQLQQALKEGYTVL